MYKQWLLLRIIAQLNCSEIYSFERTKSLFFMLLQILNDDGRDCTFSRSTWYGFLSFNSSLQRNDLLDPTCKSHRKISRKTSKQGGTIYLQSDPSIRLLG